LRAVHGLSREGIMLVHYVIAGSAKPVGLGVFNKPEIATETRINAKQLMGMLHE
jgi:hypothetical protein